MVFLKNLREVNRLDGFSIGQGFYFWGAKLKWYAENQC
jgi:hypothetical protein